MLHPRALVFFLLLLRFAGAAAAQPLETGTTARELQVGDETRTYRVHVPASYATHERPVPLVLFLHGRGGSGLQASRLYGFREKADAEGFLVAFPDALGTPRSWRAPYFPGEGDADVRFLDALLDVLGKAYRVDERRIYCTGHSSGGIMSYAVGGHLSHRVAAIGVVAGSAGFQVGGVPGPLVRAPEHPVSLIAFHGTRDSLIPYGEDDQREARYGFFLPTPLSVGYWAQRIWAIEAEERTLLDGAVRVTHYRDPALPTEAILYTLVDGGHGWPAKRGLFRGAPIAATDLTWQFFAEHPRAASPFTALFDGRSLAGFEGDERFWRVEDGAIVGESTAENPCTENTFLVWTGGTVRDFVLTFEFRVDAGNSGVQFRSRRLSGFAVGGLQADLEAGPQWTGGLYEERGTRGVLARRGQAVAFATDGTKTVDTFADAAELEAEHVRRGGWTRARIVAQGPRVEVYLGNARTASLVDHSSHAVSEGVLALQLHRGDPMKVRFRALALRHF